MSATTLAHWIDRLPAFGAFVVETAETVNASNLTAGRTLELCELVGAEGWAFNIFDQTGESWSLNDVAEDIAPFRVSLVKPAAPVGVARVLTDLGLTEWLNEPSASVCQVARLTRAFDTLGVRFTNWDEPIEGFSPSAETASPRSFVREYNGQLQAPADIRPWLLADLENAQYDNSSFRVWMAASARRTLYSLPDEIDSATGFLKFRGPPRLSLKVNTNTTQILSDLGVEGFKALQRSTCWVFDNAREAEMRHVLFATEMARSGIETDGAEVYVREYAAAALDGAKIGYQASLSQLSADTLKTLADLRKAVTEETAKVTEATRQIGAAVATALAIGIGLMAARVTAAASSNLIIAVMVVAGGYVSMVILSGLQFALLQRDLRKAWQPRLYRYLPASEYETLVLTPTGKAETSLFCVAGIGGLITVLLSALVMFPSLWK